MRGIIIACACTFFLLGWRRMADAGGATAACGWTRWQRLPPLMDGARATTYGRGGRLVASLLMMGQSSESEDTMRRVLISEKEEMVMGAVVLCSSKPHWEDGGIMGGAMAADQDGSAWSAG